ncbi:MAG: hypothetical protein QW057_02755 [Candidatus Bathyarchaeia archaeon]
MTRMKPENVVEELQRLGVTSPFKTRLFPPENPKLDKGKGKPAKLG